MVAQRRVPISLIVEELVERGLRPALTPESIAVDSPPTWANRRVQDRLTITEDLAIPHDHAAGHL